MIEIKTTTRFEQSHKKFIKNNQLSEKAVSSALKKFIYNPDRPSLNLEKLKNSKFWTIRIDRSSRIFFIWIDVKTALLIDIGPHDKYRRY